MRNKILLLLLPAFVAVAPMAVFSAKDWWEKKIAPSGAQGQAAATANPAAAIATSKPGAPADNAAAATLPPGPATPAANLEGQPPNDLAAIFNFDVTVNWILQHWPHVSANLAEIELQGYRVPLVSGTAADDVAGSLTYYFSPQQRVEKILFQGTTGDPQRLVKTLVDRFGIARRQTNNPRLIRYETVDSRGRTKSFLELRPAEVVKAEDTYGRFRVQLTLLRPE